MCLPNGSTSVCGSTAKQHCTLRLLLFTFSNHNPNILRWQTTQLKVGQVCFPFIRLRIVLCQDFNQYPNECEPLTATNVVSEAGIKVWTNSLGTPETSLRGLSTLKVLRVDKSIFAAPSSVFGSNMGRNLAMT